MTAYDYVGQFHLERVVSLTESLTEIENIIMSLNLTKACGPFSNRRQFVSLSGINSDYQTITCGVPQGSVLGPLLFLLYINDMPKCSNILEFHLFADDTNLFLNNPNILNLETDLNIELEKVSQWLYANKLSLNSDKTNFVVFHSPQRRIMHNMNLRISNTSIKSDTRVKYLGLILDSNLNWKAYIHEVKKFQEVLEFYPNLDIM